MKGTGKEKNEKGLWKFFFWPLVWLLVFWSAHIISDRCDTFNSLGLWSAIAGTIVLCWALALHIVAGKSLKKFGHTEGHTSIWPDRMVTCGIYSCMRHPQHLGLAMIPIGFALLSGSIIAVAACGWAILAALWFVIVIEEPECQKKFGEEYCRYMQATPAFSLSFICLMAGWNELKKT